MFLCVTVEKWSAEVGTPVEKSKARLHLACMPQRARLQLHARCLDAFAALSRQLAVNCNLARCGIQAKCNLAFDFSTGVPTLGDHFSTFTHINTMKIGDYTILIIAYRIVCVSHLLIF